MYSPISEPEIVVFFMISGKSKNFDLNSFGVRIEQISNPKTDSNWMPSIIFQTSAGCEAVHTSAFLGMKQLPDFFLVFSTHILLFY